MSSETNGIGLSLTKELLELHHGTISVESEVGRGSSFTVIIPIDKESYTEAEINVESSQDLKRESGIGTVNAENNILDWKQLEEGDINTTISDIRLLLVEDNEELLYLMRRILSKHYYVPVSYTHLTLPTT